MTSRFMTAIALTLLLASTQLSSAADLSPGKWPTEERAQVEKLEVAAPFVTAPRVVAGKSGVIAATMSPLAVRAGIEALKQGGTAADAAAVVALTQVVAACGSYVSYAGIFELTYYDAKTRKIRTLSAGWNSYERETDPHTIPVNDMGTYGSGIVNAPAATAGEAGRKTLVPGFMAGIDAMHREFGKLKYSTLFEPAIWYAENGITLSPLLAGYFKRRQTILSRTESGKRFLRQASIDLPQPGARFVQTELAQTLRSVSLQGAKYMYAGKWGQNFVAAVQAEGGRVTLEDMKRYTPTWTKTIETSAYDHDIVGSSESLGAISILEALNVAEELHIEKLAPYWENPQALVSLSGALRWSMATAYSPAFVNQLRTQGIDASPAQRMTKTYAKAILPMVSQSIGSVSGNDGDTHHSDAIVVTDRWGNVAVIVHSINTDTWGSTGIVVDGIPIPDPAGFQQARLATLKPGDRVPNEMAPLVVMHHGKPTVGIGTVGASLASETTRVLVGLLANRSDLQSVMAAPMLLNPIGGAQLTIVVPENAYDSDFIARLSRLGPSVQQQPTQMANALKGTAAVSVLNESTGAWTAVEVPGVFEYAGSN